MCLLCDKMLYNHAKTCTEKTHNTPWLKRFWSYSVAFVMQRQLIKVNLLPYTWCTITCEKRAGKSVFLLCLGVNGMYLGESFQTARMPWEQRWWLRKTLIKVTGIACYLLLMQLLWVNIEVYEAEIALESHKSFAGTFSKITLYWVALIRTGIIERNVVFLVMRFSSWTLSTRCVAFDVFLQRFPFISNGRCVFGAVFFNSTKYASQL